MNPADEYGRGGSARFMAGEEISAALRFGEGALFCGFHPTTDQALGFSGDQHMLTVSASGGGKSWTSARQQLATYSGNVIAVDPAGELAADTAALRPGALIFDPYNVTGRGSCAFNIFDELDDPDDALMYSRVEAAAKQFCPTRPGEGGFWADGAAEWMGWHVSHMLTATDESGRRLYAGREEGKVWTVDAQGVAHLPPPARASRLNMTTLRRNVVQAANEIARLDPLPSLHDAKKLAAWMAKNADTLIAEMLRNQWCGGLIARGVASFMALHSEFKTSVMGNVLRATAFLDAPGWEKVTGRSDFRISDFRRGRRTLYIVIPTEKMHAAGTWLRLFLQIAFLRFAEMGPLPRGDRATLFLLDEFANLGAVPEIVQAADTHRKFGIRFHFIVQEIGQLQRLYAERFASFVSGAGLIQVFAPGHGFGSAEFFSRLLGHNKVTPDLIREVIRLGNATKTIERRARDGTTEGRKWGAAMLTPDELARLLARESGNMLLLKAGSFPALVKRKGWSDCKRMFGINERAAR